MLTSPKSSGNLPFSERSLVMQINAQRSHERTGKSSLQVVTTQSLESHFDCREQKIFRLRVNHVTFLPVRILLRLKWLRAAQVSGKLHTY